MGSAALIGECDGSHLRRVVSCGLRDVRWRRSQCDLTDASEFMWESAHWSTSIGWRQGEPGVAPLAFFFWVNSWLVSVNWKG